MCVERKGATLKLEKPEDFFFCLGSTFFNMLVYNSPADSEDVGE